MFLPTRFRPSPLAKRLAVPMRQGVARGLVVVGMALGSLGLLALGTGTGHAADAVPSPAANEVGPGWAGLSPAQKKTLEPLQRDWRSLNADHKQKWLDLAERFPALPAEQQARIQARMASWARMSPAERAKARLQFQQAKQIPHDERQDRWRDYQALSPEQKRQLADRAQPAATAERRNRNNSSNPAPLGDNRPPEARKSNLVPSASPVPPLRPVSPSVVQARPGATTNLVSKRPAPPDHQQAGMPKITATPGFVDKTTLLPQRGAQGAGANTTAPLPHADDRP